LENQAGGYMATLESITRGAAVKGILPDGRANQVGYWTPGGDVPDKPSSDSVRRRYSK